MNRDSEVDMSGGACCISSALVASVPVAAPCNAYLESVWNQMHHDAQADVPREMPKVSRPYAHEGASSTALNCKDGSRTAH